MPRKRRENREYSKKWRTTNAEKLKASAKEKQDYINAVKSHPCPDCKGIFPTVCMDFDHVRGIKLFDVGHHGSRSLKAIKEEIAKCDVVCSNCHRKRTWNRRLSLG